MREILKLNQNKTKQREMAMQRMMQEVPKATVVVTNPTHIAVALRYEKEILHLRSWLRGQIMLL